MNARGPLADAFLSALIALGLFAPMVGLETHVGAHGIALAPRPLAVAALVGAVFVLRLAVRLWQARPHRAAAGPGAARARLAAALGGTKRFLIPTLLAIAVVMPFLASRATIDLGILMLTYVMLGWGLNIVVGLAGLLDLGYVAFYAVGAYSYALIAQATGLGFWSCLPASGVLAALWGITLGFPVLRLRGDYLAIVTLAFGEIIRIVLLNWVSLTGGPNGISGIPRPTLFGLRFTMTDGPGTFAGFFHLAPSPTHRVMFLFYVILGLALLTNWVTLRLRRQPLGRVWEALREDEIACRSLGINVTTTKLTAFAVGACFGGFAGAFFATRQGFISPESFTFMESATVLAIVVLGGMGSQLGVVLATLVMIGGPEMFRPLADYRMLIFGLALVVMMVLRPRGLVTERRPSIMLGAAARAAPLALAAEEVG